MQTFENSSYVMADSLYTDCWVRDWVRFVESSQGILNINVSTPEAWVGSLKEVRSRSELTSSQKQGVQSVQCELLVEES